MLTEEQILNATKDALRGEALWLRSEVLRLQREAGHQLSDHRERIMRAWIRNYPRAKDRVRWMSPTARIVGQDDFPPMGYLHVHDPAVPPHLAKPTTIRGRYQNGDIREAGPGSYIGKALCGLPMMADEMWCSAKMALQHAVNHGKREWCDCIALCGMCSYLSACATYEDALEAMTDDRH